MVEDLSSHASKFLDVLGEVAGHKLLAAGGVREARVGQGLAVRADSLPVRTGKAVNVLCNKVIYYKNKRYSIVCLNKVIKRPYILWFH